MKNKTDIRERLSQITDSIRRLPLRRILCIALCIAVIAGFIATVEYITRDPVVIAIIDTGISTKAIPADNILTGKNYLDPSLSTEDTFGHGTAVASVILDKFAKVQFVPLVSNVYDSGKIKQVSNDVFAQMIKDAVDVYGCDIINLSVGLILDKDSVREAVEYAYSKGVLIIASAGNDYATDGEFMYYPAGYDSVLAVGSVNKKRTEISDFSQRGQWVDIYACGENVKVSTLSGKSKKQDGTSFSAARVTARAAKFLQKNPSLSPAKLTEKLIRKAKNFQDGKKAIK